MDGYYDPLLALLNHAVAERFIRPEHLRLLVVSDNPEALAVDLLSHKPKVSEIRWINSEQT